jgi:hypothetical protein
MKMNIKKIIKFILPLFLQQRIKQILSNQEVRQWIKNGYPVPPPHKIKQQIIAKYQKIILFMFLWRREHILGQWLRLN